jgi:methionyl-tRNA formyltransferase
MRIVYIGSGVFGVPSLDALQNSAYSLEFIVTQPSKKAGRGRKAAPTAVARWAGENHIPFVETGDNSAPELIEKVRSFDPDLLVVIAFGQKICNELISLAPKGMINVHGSLLPKYRGAAPINWAIVNGEAETGITIVTVTEQWDAGKTLATASTEITPDDTAGRLHDRLAQIAAPVLIETLDKIEAGSAVYTDQDHSKATIAPKIKKPDGYVDFNESAEAIGNKIRGFWPWPGAACDYINQKTGKAIRVTFAMAETAQSNNPQNLPPGTLDEQLNIVCGSGCLKITRLKPAGRSIMDFNDFVNGDRVAAHDRFVKIDL